MSSAKKADSLSHPTLLLNPIRRLVQLVKGLPSSFASTRLTQKPGALVTTARNAPEHPRKSRIWTGGRAQGNIALGLLGNQTTDPWAPGCGIARQ